MTCNNLNVNVVAEGVTIMPAGEIHGHVENATPTSIVYGNTGSYGPDARIAVFKDGTRTSLVEVQQNYCFLKSGQITTKQLAGTSVKMKAIEGSYANGKGGEVIIEGAG